MAPMDNPGTEHPANDRGGLQIIAEIELLTSVPFQRMRDFYHGALGLPVVDESGDRLSFQGGSSRITFRALAPGVAPPFYHFAFNIPERSVVAAHAWLLDRVALIPIPPQLRDGAYPDEVVNYRHWNAHAIFFSDPAESVVELIARHDLANGGGAHFGSSDILCVSEIAFVVDDVPAAASRIRKATGLPQYRGAGDEFAAIGDEAGLLLVMKRGRIISFDAPVRKEVSVYPTGVIIRGASCGTHGLEGFPYEIKVVE